MSPNKALLCRIDELKVQRDKIRRTRDTLRFKLRHLENWSRTLDADHARLWMERVAPSHPMGMPDVDLVEHVAFQKAVRVVRSPDMLRSGYLCALQIRGLLHRHAATGPYAILDFGCGFGRVTRFLHLLGPDAAVFGCDIDEANIAWARANLPGAGGYFRCDDTPPLPGDLDRRFDLIIAVSVFTHLPEPMQTAWLRELLARLDKGGHLLATFHGPSYQRFIPESDRAEFDRTGFAHVDLGTTRGQPAHYLTAFHSHDYIRRMWGEMGDLLEIAEQSVMTQDAALLRSRGD